MVAAVVLKSSYWNRVRMLHKYVRDRSSPPVLLVLVTWSSGTAPPLLQELFVLEQFYMVRKKCVFETVIRKAEQDFLQMENLSIN